MADRYTTHSHICWSWGPKHYECAVREIERLQAEVKQLQADLAESDEIREKLGHLLTRTAAALKGEPPAGVWHSWHDLPEKATQLVETLRKLEEREQRDEALLREALYALEYASDMTKPEDLQGCGCPICTNIAALRERLGETTN